MPGGKWSRARQQAESSLGDSSGDSVPGLHGKRQARRPALRLLVLLFLGALICAQAASFAIHHSEQHCCALCHAGPLPFIQPGTVSALSPYLAAIWIARPLASEAPHDVLLDAGSSRAPPFRLSA